jgi:hypothetical protein
MLDSDPDQMNADPQPWCKRRHLGFASCWLLHSLLLGGRGDALHRRAVGLYQLHHLRPAAPAGSDLLRGRRSHDLCQVTSFYDPNQHYDRTR